MALIELGVAFFFIRHGETEWNREGRLQGQRDVPLNPVGRDQATSAGHILRDLLRRRGVADPASLRYVASPLSRARHTMERVREAAGLPPEGSTFEERLRELSFGAWEGLTWPEVKTIAPAAVKTRKGDKWGFVPPDGESYAMLAERVRPWIGTVRNEDVVVAHGGVARVLLHLIVGVPADTAPDLDIWQGRVLTFAEGSCRWD